VVDDDIDIHDYAAVDWAIAHRVNAGENDIIIMPSTFGAGSIPRRASATATRAVRHRQVEPRADRRHHESRLRPRPELGGARFPPKVWPEQQDIDATMARWTEFGLDKPRAFRFCARPTLARRWGAGGRTSKSKLAGSPDQNRRQHHAADDDHRKRLLNLRSDSGRHRCWQEPNASDDARHEYGAHLQFAGPQDGSRLSNPASIRLCTATE